MRWLIALLLPLLLTMSSLSSPALAAAADYPLPDGHFYQQANGEGGAGNTGYTLTDAHGIPFSTAFQQYGGVSQLGYPASQVFLWQGLPSQILQKGVLQWDGHTVQPANVLDVLHNQGLDGWLATRWLTPPPASTAPDSRLQWSQVVTRHLRFLDASPALKAAYYRVADPLVQYGLPMSPVTDEGPLLAVRCQRAVLQLWLTAQPWAAANTATVANAGDILKATGTVPSIALVPARAGELAQLTYVAIGASDALGIGASSPDLSYPAVLGGDLQQVFPAVVIDDLGISGATTAQMVTSEVPKLRELAPFLVTVTAGGNDLLDLIPPDEFQQQLHLLMQDILAVHPAVVALANLPDLGLAPAIPVILRAPAEALVQAYNTIIAQEAQADHVLLVDLYTPSVQLLSTHPNLVSADGFHPNDTGYEVYAQAFWQVLNSTRV
ncbi:MAG: SGNH/GDSL hydrolase family protein [Chloroflexi bacterium]|nr:SGNH/GDSL hydrolase family protein [Chloroflexota bacterium]